MTTATTRRTVRTRRMPYRPYYLSPKQIALINRRNKQLGIQG